MVRRAAVRGGRVVVVGGMRRRVGQARRLGGPLALLFLGRVSTPPPSSSPHPTPSHPW